MADGKKKNDGFRAGFMADMLRNLEDELGIEKKRKGDSKRGRLPKKPADPKGKTEALARRRPGLPHKAPLCRKVPLRKSLQCLLYMSRR